MTKEEIIEMVMQIGGCDRPEDDSPALKMFVTFAKLVAEKERAECANLCDEMSATECNMSKTWRSACRDMSNEIRARGQE